MTSNASLTDAQLASMRGCFATSLADTCTVIRSVESPNGAGGVHATPTNVYTGVPCSFGPFRVPFLKDFELEKTRVNAKSRWDFAFVFGTDIQIKDRIAVDGGFTYEIASHRSPETFGLYVHYLAELVD